MPEIVQNPRDFSPVVCGTFPLLRIKLDEAKAMVRQKAMSAHSGASVI